MTESTPLASETVETPESISTPSPVQRNSRLTAFVTIAIVGFSLTLLIAGIALLANYLPFRGMSRGTRIDLGALLLFAPVCALTFGIVAEVIRIALKSPMTFTQPETRRLRWSPGQREG